MSAQSYEWPNVDPETGRRAVTALAFAKSDLNGVEDAYWYSHDAAFMGLDPWSLIEGVDQHTSPASPAIDVWFSSGKCITVPKETLIYVRAKDYDKVVQK